MHSTKRTSLHPRNLHNGLYDLKRLVQQVPELGKHLVKKADGEESINFSNAEAVKALNKALLLNYYNLSYWDIPEGYLCPPVPGRADYMHYVAELLNENIKGGSVKVLDIGTGANGVYPIIGTDAYGWSFVGSEIDDIAIDNLHKIISKNPRLNDVFEIRKQQNAAEILKGIIQPKDQFELVICNPPFYGSKEEAEATNRHKVTKLSKGKRTEKNLNFGGKSNELWCPGGEKRFLSQLVNESKLFETQVEWFTTLVSKSALLKPLQNSLDYHKASEVKVIEMSQGNKISRILAWRF